MTFEIIVFDAHEAIAAEKLEILTYNQNTNTDLNELLVQKPNIKTLGLPLSLYFYNLGDKNKPNTVNEWGIKKPKTYNFIKISKETINIIRPRVSFSIFILFFKTTKNTTDTNITLIISFHILIKLEEYFITPNCNSFKIKWVFN